jgi:auxin efflux carrier family protein
MLVGISFISIFSVAFHIVFWGLGAAHSLSWDFLPNVPQGEAAERRVSWKEKPIGGWIARVLPEHTSVISGIGSNKQAEMVKEIAMDDLQESRESSKAVSDRHSDHTLHPTDPDIRLAAHISVTTSCSRQPSAPVLPAFRNQGTFQRASFYSPTS